MFWSRITRTYRHRRRSHQRGAVAVEFALVLPVLLLLVFGIIQFGFYMSQQTALNGAVRTGARYGSVNAYSGAHTCSEVINKVRSAATTIGMQSSAVKVTVSRSGTPAGGCSTDAPTGDLTTAPCANATPDIANPDTLTVVATYTSTSFLPVPTAWKTLKLAGTGAYQCEYNK